MNSITNPSLHATQGRATLNVRQQAPPPSPKRVADAKATHEAFSKFVGTTVFGQMLSSMRKTVAEPAYFHGGQAEKVFQSQLDQALADEMTTRGASPFAQAMFEQQFPDLADVLRRDAAAASEAEAASGAEAQPSALDQLNTLRRR